MFMQQLLIFCVFQPTNYNQTITTTTMPDVWLECKQTINKQQKVWLSATENIYKNVLCSATCSGYMKAHLDILYCRFNSITYFRMQCKKCPTFSLVTWNTHIPGFAHAWLHTYALPQLAILARKQPLCTHLMLMHISAHFKDTRLAQSYTHTHTHLSFLPECDWLNFNLFHVCRPKAAATAEQCTFYLCLCVWECECMSLI